MILSEKRKTRSWKFGEWVRSLIPEIRTAGSALSAKILAALTRLPEWFRRLQRVWRDRVPRDLSIALGVPLLVALLIALTGWPVSWTGQTGKEPLPGKAPPATNPALAEPEKASATPAVAPDAETAARIGHLEEQLATARNAELEIGRALARLRADQEIELGMVQEQRDKAVLKVAELESALAAMRQARTRDEASRKAEGERLGEERKQAAEQARELERKISALEAANLREKKRAEAAEERLRRREAELRAVLPEQMPDSP